MLRTPGPARRAPFSSTRVVRRDGRVFSLSLLLRIRQSFRRVCLMVFFSLNILFVLTYMFFFAIVLVLPNRILIFSSVFFLIIEFDVLKLFDIFFLYFDQLKI